MKSISESFEQCFCTLTSFGFKHALFSVSIISQSIDENFIQIILTVYCPRVF